MFHLDLEKEGETTTIDFVENDTQLGAKWAKALRDEIDKGIELPQPDRLYNLNTVWSEQSIITRINRCIHKVNTYKNFIDFQVDGSTMTQEDSNQLHHYFELMRGENDEPNEFYETAPQEIKDAIEEYNILIHRWEDLVIREPDGTRTDRPSSGRIVVHIKDRPMYDMVDGDWDCYTTESKPGAICINYCHKGKPILDIIKDRDEVVGEDNIRPQHRYSADFHLRWSYGIGHGEEWNKRFDEWWTQNHNYMRALGFERDDPRCAFGYGVVGHLVRSPIVEKARAWGSTKILGVRYT